MKVAYLTSFSMDVPSAMGLRVQGLARALAAAGDDVTVISPTGQPGTPGSDLASTHPIPERPWAETRVAAREGHVVAGAITRYRGLDEMGNRCSGGNFDRLLSYGLNLGMVRQVQRSGIQSGRVAMDIVDWYQPSHFSGPVGPLLLLEHEFLLRRKVQHVGSVVTVTNYLGQYFSKKGVRTLVVPPLIQSVGSRSLAQFSEGGSVVHLAFAGSVGGKDAATVRNLLHAAKILNADTLRIVVHLVGPGAAECERLLRAPISSVPGVVMHGRQPQPIAADIVASCDYSVLQRPPHQRYARAGFPTKVIESWVLGTPVIANLSSDLGTYLKDGFNGFLATSDRLEALLAAIQRAIDRRREVDRMEVRRWAESEFAPAVYADRLHDFLSNDHRESQMPD